MKQILLIAVLSNFLVFLILSTGFIPVTEAQLRFSGGIFLMIFVCTHGWYRYGLTRMVQFFCITLVVTWSLESLSMLTGFPFGHFVYSDKLGEKIGAVPVMIVPAYFFNGYLAWTMAGIFRGHKGTGINQKNVVIMPLVAACLMVAWNICFDPIMSTLKGYWIWRTAGPYYGVPLSNFAGWFLTVYLFFQIFAIVLYRNSQDQPVTADPHYWMLIPVLYIIQGLPYLIYPLYRTQGAEIYQPVALITLIIMIGPAVLNMISLRSASVRNT